MRRPRARRAAPVVALVVAVLLAAGVAVHPAVRATLQAVFVLDGALDGPLPRPWALPVERREQELGGVTVDRYSSVSGAPAVLLLPGAAPAGRDDRRVVSLASSLAAAGRAVVVPELALYDQDLDVDDVGRVVDVAAALCGDDAGLVLLGFSYGGSLALVASADERVAGCIELVATFGAYGDLVGVIQAAVTGVSVVDGERYPWLAADADVVRTVVRDTATRLVPADQRTALRRALAQQDPSGLPDAADLVYRMVTTDDPVLVAELARQLPPVGRTLVETFSPVDAADRIEADLLFAHALEDPAVPVAELRRLGAAFPDARTMTVRSFDHVDLATDDGLGPLLADLLTGVGFLQAVLRPQEHWPWR